MTSEQSTSSLRCEPAFWPQPTSDPGLGRVAQRLAITSERSRLVQEALDTVRMALAIDRVVLYSFSTSFSTLRLTRQWRGQVIAESLVDPSLSILGTPWTDPAFGNSHVRRYLQGQVDAIADLAAADLPLCHRRFLQSLCVRAYLAAPVRLHQNQWGLLVAHHCKGAYAWSAVDIATLSQVAYELDQSSTLHPEP